MGTCNFGSWGVPVALLYLLVSLLAFAVRAAVPGGLIDAHLAGIPAPPFNPLMARVSLRMRNIHTLPFAVRPSPSPS